MTTFVAVGNRTEPFRRLLVAVAAVASRFPQPVVVQHGVADFPYSGCQPHAYVSREEFGRLISSADLVVCHAGAGCVIEALRAKRVPVVMPRRKALGEVLDDHQADFAHMLAESGKAVVVDDPAQLEKAAAWALRMQSECHDTFRDPPLIALLQGVLRDAEQRRSR